VTYVMLKFLHLLGAILIGGGLIGVWLADLRSRRLRRLPAFAESVRNIAVFYDGLVVPGAILLLISGAWLIVEFFDGWEFVKVPWLAGMVFLFAFEFVEGNTVTRLYFTRLRRLTNEALKTEKFTPEAGAGSGRARSDVYPLPRSADSGSHCGARFDQADDLAAVHDRCRAGPYHRWLPDRMYPKAVPVGRGRRGRCEMTAVAD
jgi:uncharacterized membrane protein